MKSILLAIVFLMVAMMLLCVGVIFRNDHTFRSQHIHQNARLKKDNIHCAKTLDKEAERKSAQKINVSEL
ncbi:MAG: hypothetical protein IJQ18_06710 [Paludibacteraceae bacterium]|nr:hypothetical protein [Paludibacteraceae bacterium]